MFCQEVALVFGSVEIYFVCYFGDTRKACKMSEINYKIELRAESLLDKFGFCDGDLFVPEVEEYWDECIKRGIPTKHGLLSDTLVAVVKKYLLPTIPFQIECSEAVTMHNPIRLVKFDGQDITTDNYDTIKGLLKGEKAIVDKAQVVEIIQQLGESCEN